MKKYRFLFIRWKRPRQVAPCSDLTTTPKTLKECVRQLEQCKALIAEHQEKWESYEKQVIATSPYWDPLWYVQRYNHKFDRYEALEYWYKEGYKRGEYPSREIQRSIVDKKPSTIMYHAVHTRSSLFFGRQGNLRHLPNEQTRIAEYLEYKSQRTAKGVVYCCITNGYDNISDMPIHRYCDKDWDYVCFSDDEKHLQAGQIGVWEIRPLFFSERDSTRNSRWHKTHPHVLFPKYEESIFIDGNVNILSDYLFRTIRAIGSNIVLPRHFKNLCIYQEYKDVLSANLDDVSLINEELKLIKETGMPEMYGMGETNILYRKHSENSVQKICDEWWDMISRYSKRDQLAFTYILWKHKILLQDITYENARMQKDHFFLFNHKKPHP